MKSFKEIKDLKVSEKLIFRIVHQYGPITNADILKRTGGSLSTVYRMLGRMAEDGLVLESDGDNAVAGRKPSIYTINPNAYFAVGAYITWDAYGIGICSINGDIIAQQSARLKPDDKPTDVAAFYKQAIEQFTENSGIDKKKLLGLGLSVTGPTVKEKGIMIHPHHMEQPHWDIVPIRDIVEMAVEIDTYIHNHTDAALLCEILNNTNRTENHIAYLYFDRGIGSEMFDSGIIGYGNGNSSGDLGHMVIDPEGEECVCGCRGCLETYASSGAISNIFGKSYPKAKKPNKTEILTCSENVWKCDPDLLPVEKFLRRNGPDKDEFIYNISTPIEVAIRNFVTISRPEVVFYGGRVIEQLGDIFDHALLKAKSNSYLNLVEKVKFIKSSFDNELLIRGGGYYVFDHFIGLTKSIDI
jgi:predicted NBD/HSP70 family sugar kinase